MSKMHRVTGQCRDTHKDDEAQAYENAVMVMNGTVHPKYPEGVH